MHSTSAIRGALRITITLVKGINSDERGWFLCSLPILNQFRTMQVNPLAHQPLCSAWQLASKDFAIIDPEQRFVLGVQSMKSAAGCDH